LYVGSIPALASYLTIMNKNVKNFQILNFIYKTSIKNFKFYIALISFSCIYWGIDLSFRPYIGKLVSNALVDLERVDAFAVLLPYLFLYFCSMFARFVIFRLYDYAWLKMEPQVKHNVAEALVEHVCTKADVFAQTNISGNYNNQLQEISIIIPEFVNLIFNNFIAHFFALSMALWMFANVSFNFLILLSVLILSFVILSLFTYFKEEYLSSVVTQKQMQLFGQIGDLFSNIFSVRIFNAEKREIKRMVPYFGEFKTASINKDIFSLTVHAIESLIFMAYQCGCFILLVYEYQKGVITVGDFIFIFGINRDIAECLWMVADDIAKFAKRLGSIKMILNEMLKESKLKHLEGDLELGNKFSIEFVDVSFKYEKSTQILFSGLSFKIEHGEKIGIVGYSGSGKSSLINLILKLCDVDAGKIMIAENDIHLYTAAKIRDNVSVILQDLTLFNRSILDNIRYGSPKAAMEEVIKAASEAQIHDFIDGLDKKYETMVELKGNNFSFGQKQRILIARAILKNAPILIMDEATSALDLQTENQLRIAMKELMKGKTVIVIAHKLNILSDMDRVFVMEKGQIVQMGPPAKLLKEDGLYKTLAQNVQIA
jgi:ATP-binding cassette subfamily B protein